MENEEPSETRMSDIGYTLLTGRHHFRYRCAVVVQNREDGLYALKQFEKKQKRPNVFGGEVPPEFKGQSMIKEYIADLAQQTPALYQNRQKYQEVLTTLAELYCQGYELPAEMLYGASGSRRIHLPTYPFAREEYWVKATADHLVSAAEVIKLQGPGPAAEWVNGNGHTDVKVPTYDNVPDRAVPEPGASSENTLVGKVYSNETGISLKDQKAADDFEEKVRNYVKMFIASTINLQPDKIEAGVQLEHYGLDSILMIQLKNQLEVIFGELPANVFFEYPTVEELAQYFINTHPEKLPDTLRQQGHLPANQKDADSLLNTASPQHLFTPEVSPQTNPREELAREALFENHPQHVTMADFLKSVVSSIINLSPEKIEADIQLEQYGIDSIVTMQLKNQLEKSFGELPANLFYEYPTVRDLTQYFLKTEKTEIQW